MSPIALETLAAAVHADTLSHPAPMASNTAMLDRAAPETEPTEQTVTSKRALIDKVKTAMSDVRAYKLGKGPLQAKVVGFLAELLLLRPTNKELAEAVSEQYSESYHGPVTPTTTVQVAEGREPYTDEPKTKPNPYAQAVRRYKFLARIEAGLPDPEWDADTFGRIRDTGVIINSVTYASPVAALTSGVVTLEAVFQAWYNILQPRIVDLHKWSTSQVEEARKAAPSIRVSVRVFNKKMKREQKTSVVAVHSASCLYGLIMGLLTWEPSEDSKVEAIRLGRERADKLIAAINAKVNVADEEPAVSE